MPHLVLPLHRPTSSPQTDHDPALPSHWPTRMLAQRDEEGKHRSTRPAARACSRYRRPITRWPHGGAADVAAMAAPDDYGLRLPEPAHGASGRSRTRSSTKAGDALAGSGAVNTSHRSSMSRRDGRARCRSTRVRARCSTARHSNLHPAVQQEGLRSTSMFSNRTHRRAGRANSTRVRTRPACRSSISRSAFPT